MIMNELIALDNYDEYFHGCLIYRRDDISWKLYHDSNILGLSNSELKSIRP